MPMPPLPSSVNLSKWKAVAKDDKAVAPALEKVAKAVAGLDPKKFVEQKPTTVEDAAKVRKEIDDYAKTVQSVLQSIDSFSTLGTKQAADLKKSKPDAEKLLRSMLADLGNFAKSLEGAYDSVQAGLSDHAEKLEAAKAKAEAAATKAAEKDSEGESESDDLANEKDDRKFFQNLKGKYKGFFNGMRNIAAKMSLNEIQSDKKAQWKFRMVSSGKTFGVGISKNSWGEAEIKVARRMAGLTSGGKDSKGIVYWNPEDKVFVFEGANVPSGAANATALKIAMRTVVGFAPKVRLQKPGEKGEDSEGEAEFDPDSPEAAAEAAPTAAREGGASPAAAEQARTMVARLDQLKPRIEQRTAAGGADADKLRQLEAGIRQEAARNPDLARRLFEGLAKLLGATAAGAAAGAAGADGGAAPQAAGATAQQAAGATAQQAAGSAAAPLMAKLGKARIDWVATRERFTKEVQALAASLDSLYAEELKGNDPAVAEAIAAAKAKLNQTAELIGSELEDALDAVLNAQARDAQVSLAAKARDQLRALIGRLGADPVFKSLDGKNNELNPNMDVVKDVQTKLGSISEALKI